MGGANLAKTDDIPVLRRHGERTAMRGDTCGCKSVTVRGVALVCVGTANITPSYHITPRFTCTLYDDVPFLSGCTMNFVTVSGMLADRRWGEKTCQAALRVTVPENCTPCSINAIGDNV